MKVKVFTYANSDETQKSVNSWLKKNPDVQVLHFQHSVSAIPPLPMGHVQGLVSIAIGYEEKRQRGHRRG